MTYYATNDELYHFGVKGMKWGVRRYKDYPGSYTQRGVKRFNKAMDNYDAANSKYKSTKTAYKNKQATKLEVNQAKQSRKTAERELKTQYKKLKNDKLADQGKELYRNNKRILANKQTVSLMAAATAITTKVLYDSGDKKMADVAFLGGGALTTAYALVTEYQNRRLRAYYAH